MQVRGSSALVTGAGRGIGRAVALALGRAGASVTLVARSASEIESVAREVRAAGAPAVAFAGDLTEGGICTRAVEAAVAAHGGLQVLVHLAACLMLEVRQQGVKVTTIAPGSVDTGFGGAPRGDTSWMLTAEDVARAVMDLLEARDGAHLSRVEMRPARPQK